MAFRTISARDMNKVIGDRGHLIIDLRTRQSYNMWHIPGALNIPFEELNQKENVFDRSKTLVFYCERGNLSMIAANKLSAKGYRTVSLVGGITEYNRIFH